MNLRKNNVQTDEARQAAFDDGSIHDILVLDVAGGKGDLSWLLRHVNGIPSVVIDPRGSYNNNKSHDRNDAKSSTTRSHHIEKSVQYLLRHPEEAQRRAVPGLPTFQPLAALISQIVEQTKTQKRQRQDQESSFQTDIATNEDDDTSPPNDLPVLQFQPVRHMPIYMNDDLVNAVRQQLELLDTPKVDLGSQTISGGIVSQNDGEVFSKHASVSERWKTYWREAFGNQTGNEANSDCYSDPIIAWNTFRSAKLIVGFHPDQGLSTC